MRGRVLFFFFLILFIYFIVTSPTPMCYFLIRGKAALGFLVYQRRKKQAEEAEDYNRSK
jgi:hypothetical protein